jgi:O-antigen ligase
VPFLAVTLLVRVLTDDLSSPDSRHSGSLNMSGAIAALLILVAVVMLIRGWRGTRVTALALLWLGVWTAVAIVTRGASTETVREGVREASVLALAAIVYNARGAVSPQIATRLVQVLAFVPALIALYQLATHTGMNVTGELRSNGTFAFPTSAAMFFAIAATVSLWRYLHAGANRLDALLVVLFAVALIATFSIDGLITLVAMLVALGLLRPGSWRVKMAPCLVAGVVALGFFATPLGSQRISSEAATNVAETEGGTSLAWRLHKWKMLLSQWERSPVLGRGLGTTLTVRAAPGDRYSGKPPHNEYIRYLVESGVIGMALLLIGLAALIRSLLRLWRRTGRLEAGAGGPGARAHGLQAGALGAPVLGIVVVLGCLVNALADNTFINSPTCYAAALIVVAVLSLPSVDARLALTDPAT